MLNVGINFNFIFLRHLGLEHAYGKITSNFWGGKFMKRVEN